MAAIDYYNEAYSADEYIYGVNWGGCTFTASTTYDIESIKLLLRRTGSPGTITVHLRDASGDVPSDEDLATGTFAGNTVTTDSAGEWIEFTLSSSISLTLNTQYAIVLDAADGSSSQRIEWKKQNGDPYAGGRNAYSVNSGVAWTGYSTYDNLFETYGVEEEEIIYEDATGTTDIASAVTGTPNVVFGAIGAVAITLTPTGTATAVFGATGTVTIVSTLTARAVRVMLRDPLKGVGRLLACGNNELWFEDL